MSGCKGAFIGVGKQGGTQESPAQLDIQTSSPTNKALWIMWGLTRCLVGPGHSCSLSVVPEASLIPPFHSEKDLGLADKSRGHPNCVSSYMYTQQRCSVDDLFEEKPISVCSNGSEADCVRAWLYPVTEPCPCLVTHMPSR